MWSDKKLVEVLKSDGVAVMPTDTLYGIVGSAFSVETVNRIYNIRKRNPEKPCIILIGDISELTKFSVTLTETQKDKVKEFKEPVSFILDCVAEKFAYLHRGTKTLAFRLPAQGGLRELLKKTGPLIAPSANTEGLPPAQNINEAKKYFGEAVDLYIDGGEIKSEASRVIKLNEDGSVDVLR